MPLYEIDGENLKPKKPSGFGDLGLLERDDLQRLLRQQVKVLGDEIVVIAEEFGNWEDSKRRIDLLALDSSARLVVIELKRTNDGGHMELQAVRYAAMVAAMTFDEVVATYAAFKAQLPAIDTSGARTELAEFLGREVSEEIEISSEVRIMLVSADFGREITTAVLWLNSFDRMDIRCIRLVPYQIGESVYIDVQQVIPLPEAADYQVRLRKKDNAQARSSTAADGRDFTRFHLIVKGNKQSSQNKRNTVRLMVTELVNAGVPCTEISTHLSNQELRSLPGQLTDAEEVRLALMDKYPTANPDRWFCEYPVIDKASDCTYVVWKMWGANTEGTLQKLAATFPHTGITFEVATAE